jgi:hypothetical protein
LAEKERARAEEDRARTVESRKNEENGKQLAEKEQGLAEEERRKRLEAEAEVRELRAKLGLQGHGWCSRFLTFSRRIPVWFM